jgi:protein-tyrosine phosphatase
MMPVIVAPCSGPPALNEVLRCERLRQALIDLHCHILPGVDDGALDIDDSAAMARQAATDGIEAICATPHIRHDHDVRIHEVAERVAALNRRLRDERIGVEVLTGGEVAATAVAGLSEEDLARVALGGGRWVLLEPAPGPLDERLLACVAHLAERGHRSLIAHPERHLSADMFERIAALIDAGALVQATADFFLRERTAAGMRSLAEAGLVHVLSSDAHSSHGGRPVHLAAAFEKLAEIESLRPHVEWMAEVAPRAIVEGADLNVPFDPAL